MYERRSWHRRNGREATTPGGRMLKMLSLYASCVLVVAVSARLISLNRAYAELRGRLAQPQVGDAVPAFLAETVGGDTLTIGKSPDSTARQVLFVLSTTCQFCKATLPVWRALADSLGRVRDVRIRVVAISVDSAAATRHFAAEEGVGYPMVTFPTDRLRRLYRVKAVPQTVVLDAEGDVVYAHVGRLTTGPVLDSIFQAAAWRPPTARPAMGATPVSQSQPQ
jgi:peroxiredoxin